MRGENAIKKREIAFRFNCSLGLIKTASHNYAFCSHGKWFAVLDAIMITTEIWGPSKQLCTLLLSIDFIWKERRRST